MAAPLADELAMLAHGEPPFLHAGYPVHVARYRRLLGMGVEPGFGLIYELPHGLQASSGMDVIMGDSARVQALADRLRRDGMPQALVELGFVRPADFWTPWVAVMVDDEIASIAFAARLSDVGAELGLVTVAAFRGRGFGAEATAAWSRLDVLGDRTLFYSTERPNRSSRRVTERLGLHLRGASMRIR